jgi:hypothetical protein
MPIIPTVILSLGAVFVSNPNADAGTIDGAATTKPVEAEAVFKNVRRVNWFLLDMTLVPK